MRVEYQGSNSFESLKMFKNGFEKAENVDFCKKNSIFSPKKRANITKNVI